MNKPEITGGTWESDGVFITSSEQPKNVVAHVSNAHVSKEQKEANAQAISAVPELIDVLIETDKDLCVLETTMRQIEKSDSRAEGMTNLVIEWRKRNKQALLKAGCYE
ncbi:MAG: hypothetical protein ABJG33_00210 [Balneola sp.]